MYSCSILRNRLLPSGANFVAPLCYGIDRAGLVRDILLAGQALEVSPGEWPISRGRSRHDPVGYAYNQQLSVRPYEPRLAAVLAEVARALRQPKSRRPKPPGRPKGTVEAEGTRKQGTKAVAAVQTPEVPSLGRKANGCEQRGGLESGPKQDQSGEFQSEETETQPLVFCTPPEPVARAMCQSIKLQLDLVGIPIELRELPDGSPVVSATAGATARSQPERFTTICFTPSWPCGNRWLTPDACWDRED